MNYRKIWENNFGPIPKDEYGRTYEIHHIDGDRNNNKIENLECITIQEHYNKHYKNGEYGACVMIAKRMNLPPEYLSEIQRGKKRPGIGGVKKGTSPWNKGKSGYKLKLSEEGLNNKIKSTKSKAKIQDSDANFIREQFMLKIDLNNNDIGKVLANGKKLTYERAFCKHFCKIYDVSEQYIFRIIRGQSKIV
jgi:hypothetical protein